MSETEPPSKWQWLIDDLKLTPFIAGVSCIVFGFFGKPAPVTHELKGHYVILSYQTKTGGSVMTSIYTDKMPYPSVNDISALIGSFEQSVTNAAKGSVLINTMIPVY